MVYEHNMLETLLPVIDMVLYIHNFAMKAILSFWVLIALYKHFANLCFRLRFTWVTPAIWFKSMVWAALDKSYNLHTAMFQVIHIFKKRNYLGNLFFFIVEYIINLWLRYAIFQTFFNGFSFAWYTTLKAI